MTRHWLTVALPKGRLSGEVRQLLVAAGLRDPKSGENADVLVEEDGRNKLRFAWVRPEDALTYVERGVAWLGIVGKDVLLERGAVVDEVADLGIGRCRICVAVPVGVSWPPAPAGVGSRPVRVATHLPNLTQAYLREAGLRGETITLRGSVEIAPRLGLADAVVDIVQTGRTLTANGLVPVTEILTISARLVAHPGARRGGDPRVAELIDKLKAAAAKLERQAEVIGSVGKGSN